jgi:hypothetical protein
MGRCDALVHVLQLLPDHKSLRVTPAIEAGITDHQWRIQELISTQV